MGDDSWREIEVGWEEPGEDVEATPFDDKTPDKLTLEPEPESAATADAETAPEAAASFEEEGDTVFEGDQPTVDYLEDEVPDHVAAFLGEGTGPEVLVAPPPAASEKVVPVAGSTIEGEDPSLDGLDDIPGLRPANLTLIVLLIGVVVAVAAVIYAAFL